MFLLNFFKKAKKEDELTAENMFKEDEIIEPEVPKCKECELNDHCSEKYLFSHLCEHSLLLGNYDKNKDTILIIDDNEGMVSFLKDDLEYFKDKGIIRDQNIISLSGPYAAFSLELLYNKLETLNIKWAIIDITLGGSKMTDKGNVRYTGVDVFEMIYDHTPDFKFLFYTGNNLNPYIKSNQKLIEQFKNVTGEDIKDYVLFKTSMDMDTRREHIKERLFD